MPTTQSLYGLHAYWFWQPRILTSFPDLFSKSITIGVLVGSVRQSVPLAASALSATTTADVGASMSYSVGYLRLASGYSSVSRASSWYVITKYLNELSSVTAAEAPLAMPTTQSLYGLHAYWFWQPRILTSFPDLFSKSITIGVLVVSVRQSVPLAAFALSATTADVGASISYSVGYLRLASGYSSPC